MHNLKLSNPFFLKLNKKIHEPDIEKFKEKKKKE